MRTSRTPLNRPGIPSYSILAGMAATPFISRPATFAEGGAGGGAGEQSAAPSSEDEALRLAVAATFLRSAMSSGRLVGHLRTPEALASIAWYYSTSHQCLLWLALCGLIALAFFEDGPDALPSWITLLAEAGCLFLVFGAALEERRFMGKAYLRSAVCVFHSTVLLLLCMEFLMTLINPPGAALYRYARSLRPLLLMRHAPRLRERLIDLFRVGWGARMPILLLYFNLVMFSMFAVTLFHGTPEGDEHFATLGDALTTMIILQTTCNSPGVLMPAFAQNRSSSLFFVLFLILSHFLLINLILGAVYNVHKEHLLQAAAYELLEERVAARCCMAALADDIGTGRNAQVVPFALVVKMLVVEFGFHERAAAELVRKIGGSSELGVPRSVFSDLPIAIRLRLVGATSAFRDEDESEGFLQRFYSAHVDLLLFGRVNVVIFLVSATLFASVAATVYFMYNDLDEFVEREPRDLYAINSIITLFFVLEIVGKVWAWGTLRFTDDPWNIFDAVIVLISVIGLICGQMGWISNHAAILLRDARLLRLVRVVPAFRILTSTAWAFAPAAAPFFGAAACVFYSTAICIVGVLGQVRLAPEDYRGNDFRDFSAALLTLFELAVVNDWNLTMKAFVQAMGDKRVRFFFVGWWSVSFLLLFNSVTSLILEGFDNQIKGRLTDAPVLLRRRASSVTLLDLDAAKSSSSFTLGRLFLDLFRNLEEPSDAEVDHACWEAGVRVGSFEREMEVMLD